VPAVPSLASAQLFGQWLNLADPRVSTALPVTTSNGVAFTLGGVVGMPGFTLTGDPTTVNGATWTYVATVGGVSYDLQGRLFKPSTPPAGGHALYPAVIISHGAGGNVNAYSAQIAHTMVTWGLVCIMTNLTHAGGVPLGSPGLATERGSSAANVLRNRKLVDLLQGLGYVDLRRLAAHGHSMGAFATGALLGSHPGLFLVGSHTAGGMSTQAGAAATTLAQAQAIRAPYQLHHGDADTVVPLAMDQALSNQLAANPTVHQLLVYPGFTHPQIANDPTMLATVRAWYTTHGLLP
jgi:dienelactone hydrolase